MTAVIAAAVLPAPTPAPSTSSSASGAGGSDFASEFAAATQAHEPRADAGRDKPAARDEPATDDSSATPARTGADAAESAVVPVPQPQNSDAAQGLALAAQQAATTVAPAPSAPTTDATDAQIASSGEASIASVDPRGASLPAPTTETQSAPITGDAGATGSLSGRNSGAPGEAVAALATAQGSPDPEAAGEQASGSGGGAAHQARHARAASRSEQGPIAIAMNAAQAGTAIEVKTASTPATAEASPASRATDSSSVVFTAVTTQTGQASAPVTTASPTTASGPATALAQQLSPHLASIKQLPLGEHRMTLTVNPESFGPVRVIAHITADSVSVQLIGASEAAKDALRAALPELRRDLAGAGISGQLDLGSDAGGFDPRGFDARGFDPKGADGSPGQGTGASAGRGAPGDTRAAVVPQANSMSANSTPAHRGGIDLVL